MPRFDHLYVQALESPATQLREALAAAGWQAYDPFPGGVGTPPALRQFVRLLISPPTEGWVRAYGDPTAAFPAVIRTLSAGRLAIHVWLADKQGGLDAYVDGHAKPDRLAALVRSDADTLDETQPGPNILPAGLDALAVQGNVNPSQASSFINRVARQVLGGKAQAEQASALIAASGPDWGSEAGRALIQRLGQFTLPGHPRSPLFETIREAYHAARAIARQPTASLLPSERAALTAIPNAGDFQPVYMGRP